MENQNKFNKEKLKHQFTTLSGMIKKELLMIIYQISISQLVRLIIFSSILISFNLDAQPADSFILLYTIS